MNEKRKIIIPIGAQTDDQLSTPHFDAEATSSARPVVPLSEQETFQIQYGAYQANAGKPFWKRPGMLALVVLVAVGAGVAVGFGISIYRNRQPATAPVVTSPSSVGESAEAGPTPAKITPAPAPSTVPQAPAETAAKREDEDRDSTAENKPGDTDDNAPVVRNRKPAKTDDEADPVIEDRAAERERRREERRERRRREREENEPVDIPRRIDRAGREINGRIREIFEGRQP